LVNAAVPNVPPEPQVKVPALLIPEPPLVDDNIPATSAVAKSTASVVPPDPLNIDAVKVSETIASVTEFAGRVKVPVVKVRPFDAVNNPAEVIVPVPVDEILLDVEIVFAVAIVPKPDAMEPDVRTSTESNDEAVTVPFNVVPVNVPAAAVIVLVVPYVIPVPLIVVPLVVPVPPLATANVPARVIAPLVAEAGVNPVVPPENEETPVEEVKYILESREPSPLMN